MLRKALVGSAVFVSGYLTGLLFGYRTAVVDYVENDAQTIERIADTMYGTVEEEDLPGPVRQAIEEARQDEESADSNDGRRGFQ